MQQKYFVKKCVKKERKENKDKNILTGREKKKEETV
jgi:hypothetical protein